MALASALDAFGCCFPSAPRNFNLCTKNDEHRLKVKAFILRKYCISKCEHKISFFTTENQAMTEYESGILKTANICDVCFECNFCNNVSTHPILKLFTRPFVMTQRAEVSLQLFYRINRRKWRQPTITSTKCLEVFSVRFCGAVSDDS